MNKSTFFFAKPFISCFILLCIYSCEFREDDTPTVPVEEEKPIVEEIVDGGLDTLGNWQWVDYGELKVAGNDLIFASPDTAYIVNRIFFPFPGMLASYDGGRSWLPGDGTYRLYENYNTVHVIRGNKIVLYGKHEPYLGSSNYSIGVYNLDFSTFGNSTYYYLIDSHWRGFFMDVESLGENIYTLSLIGEVLVKGSTYSYLKLDEPGLQSIAFATDSIGFIGSNKGKLLRTKDGNNSWQTMMADPDGLSFIEISFFDSNLGFVLTNSNVLYRTADGGESWSRILLPHNPRIQDIYRLNKRVVMVSPTRGFTNFDREVFETNDGGLTWTRSLRVGKTSIGAISFDKQNTLWAISDGLLKLDLD